jgi:hypothetical protein
LFLSLLDGITGQTYQLAFISELKNHASGMIQAPHGFVRFLEQPAVDYHTAELQRYRRFIEFDRFVSLAHLVPEELGKSWLLNTHVDHMLYNMIY